MSLLNFGSVAVAAIISAFCLVPAISLNAQSAEEIIIQKERTALNRWIKGDTFGFIEIAADDITYFDPGLEKRVTGIQEFHDHYASFNGTFSFPKYELINPRVQLYDKVGILTFNFVGYSKEGKEELWNTTEVYRLIGEDWKIVSSHWSPTQPKK